MAPSTPTSSSTTNVPRSPFFKPSSIRTPDEIVELQTPGGTKRKVHHHQRRGGPSIDKEHKSTRLGCTANLINAIIGSGIVGIPYAIRNAGFVAGIFLIVLCAMLTDKSLRLLIATAKHANVPSYETVAEAAFGTWGFGFICINMMIMAYGAMLSYLMIVKDTFSVALGVDPANLPAKRAILTVISLLIMVPLSSQRDMADLAKTSRISVVIDCLLVLVVVYQSPVSTDRVSSLFQDSEWLATDFWIHTETIFVGLGVLSFAFVCQHSAFIIAGSLHQPTVARWSQVTNAALTLCATLALLCGIAGYLGFVDDTKGNVLNNLQVDDILSNVARSFLGTTMLFVYPMESFVARHVLVVLLFEGRRAHDGDDASMLSRWDRRIGLTLALYISALLPALLFQDLGHVLAATGAVGGSCLSYIGPGAIYMGIHGDQFLKLIREGSWWKRFIPAEDILEGLHTHLHRNINDNKSQPTKTPTETTSLLQVNTGDEVTDLSKETSAAEDNDDDNDNPSCFIRALQDLTWYILGMPIWCWIARFGEKALDKHRHDMALKSPHPLRIGDVAPDTPKPQLRQKSMMSDDSDSQNPGEENLSLSYREDMARANSFREGGLVGSSKSGRIAPKGLVTSSSKSPSLNQQIGAKLLAKQRHDQERQAIEKDPQKAPPTVVDFLIAIFLILFGIVALFAGLVSIGLEAEKADKAD